MNRQSSPKTRFSIYDIWWLAIMVLGVGFIGFALMNIMPPVAKTINNDTSSSFTPTADQISTPSGAVGRTELMENELQLVTPNSDISLYPVYPSEGDVIGSLSMPALELELPIIQGTGTDDLKNGVGHFVQSVLPGEVDNCVLSGHRDTVFAGLDKLKIGDLLIVKTSAGTFTYEVSGTRIVDKDDKTVIVPTDHAVLTLTTCYPFGYIGPAPDRYIVSANLVTNKKTEIKRDCA